MKQKSKYCGLWMYFQPNSTGEQKTKPTQNSVRELRGLGLSPDLVRLYSLLYTVKSQSMSSHSSSEKYFFFVADCLSLLNSIGNCCQRENLHVLPRGTWTGDLRAWRVLNLQSTFTPGGSGHCWILMPQTGLAHWDETSKNAHKVEGDIRPVCVVSIHFNSPKNCNLLSIPRLLQLFWVTCLCS